EVPWKHRRQIYGKSGGDVYRDGTNSLFELPPHDPRWLSRDLQSKRAGTPCALNRAIALRSKETNSSPPSQPPSWAMTPSAKSPPASSIARPASAAGRLASTL